MLRRSLFSAAMVCALLIAAIPAFAGAADESAKDAGKNSQKDEQDAKDEFSKLPPFPADKTISQSTMLNGSKLNYNATVGSLPVRDDKGKVIADVMFVAYTKPGKDRPITFA